MSSNSERVQQTYDAFGRGDVAAVLGVLSPQVQWRVPVSLPFEDQVGPEAVGRNIFALLPTLFDGFAVEISELLAGEGDDVVALGTYHATGRRTGKRLDADFVHVWRFGPDGKARFFRSYTDTYQWREVLGEDQEASVPSQGRSEAATPSRSR